MTALGKTLVFFVLLFSLVTGGMIVVVFLTRTNWKAAYQSADTETRVAVANLKAEQDKAKREREAMDVKFKAQEKQIADLERDRIGLQTEVKNKNEQLAAEQAKAGVELTNSQTATNEINKLHTERDQM